MADDPESERVRAPVVTVEKGTERLAVAALCGEHQVPIINSFTSSGRLLPSLIHGHAVRSYITRTGVTSVGRVRS